MIESFKKLLAYVNEDYVSKGYCGKTDKNYKIIRKEHETWFVIPFLHSLEINHVNISKLLDLSYYYSDGSISANYDLYIKFNNYGDEFFTLSLFNRNDGEEDYFLLNYDMFGEGYPKIIFNFGFVSDELTLPDFDLVWEMGYRWVVQTYKDFKFNGDCKLDNQKVFEFETICYANPLQKKLGDF